MGFIAFYSCERILKLNYGTFFKHAFFETDFTLSPRENVFFSQNLVNIAFRGRGIQKKHPEVVKLHRFQDSAYFHFENAVVSLF